MNRKILFVDDDPNILAGFARTLRNDYEVTTACSGNEALDIVKNSGPFSVIISDYKMPEMDGIKFLSLVRQMSPDSIRVMLTGFANVQATIDAVNEGNIFRFLTKPCPPEKISRMLDDAVRQYELVISERELLSKTLKGSIKVLIDILSVTNPLAFSRASRILKITDKLTTNLDPEIKWKVEIAALLSQIGCVAIPTEILEKKNKGETLTKKERDLYLTHPQIGKTLISNIPRLEDVAEAISKQFSKFKAVDENADSINGKRIAAISRIIKHATDLNALLEHTKPGQPITTTKIIDLEFDEVSEDELSGFEKNFEPRRLLLQNLVPGMLLGEDIADKNGFALVSQGQELSEAMIIRLLNLAKMNAIAEPITVLIPKVNKPD